MLSGISYHTWSTASEWGKVFHFFSEVAVLFQAYKYDFYVCIVTVYHSLILVHLKKFL